MRSRGKGVNLFKLLLKPVGNIFFTKSIRGVAVREKRKMSPDHSFGRGKIIAYRPTSYLFATMMELGANSH